MNWKHPLNFCRRSIRNWFYSWNKNEAW